MGFVVNFPLNGGTATSRALLVDLSDTSGFPHNATNYLSIQKVAVDYAASGTLGGTSIWNIKVGEVLNNGSAVGTVQYFGWLPVFAGQSGSREYDFAAGGKHSGLPLVLSSSAPVAWDSGSVDTGATWAGTASTYNTGAGGTAGRCGAGDLVAEFEEAVDGATLSASITVEYEAR